MSTLNHFFITLRSQDINNMFYIHLDKRLEIEGEDANVIHLNSEMLHK